jgi:hypothetical protein
LNHDGATGQAADCRLTAELIKAKVDSIVTAGRESAAAARQATSSLPVVMARAVISSGSDSARV